MNSNKIIAGVAVVAVAGLLGGSLWFVTLGAPDDPFQDCRQTAVAGGAGAIGGPFTLVDESGRTVTDADVFQQPALVYFGYTFCPDVCPLDNARNADAVALLQERNYAIRPVFITIDPDRDTPEVLAEFTDYLHPDMLGLTGTPEQIKAASQAYRTYYRKQDGDPEYYLMDHSTFTYLVLPEVGFVEFFRREMTAQAVAESAACFLDHATSGLTG